MTIAFLAPVLPVSPGHAISWKPVVEKTKSALGSIPGGTKKAYKKIVSLGQTKDEWLARRGRTTVDVEVLAKTLGIATLLIGGSMLAGDLARGVAFGSGEFNISFSIGRDAQDHIAPLAIPSESGLLAGDINASHADIHDAQSFVHHRAEVASELLASKGMFEGYPTERTLDVLSSYSDQKHFVHLGNAFMANQTITLSETDAKTIGKMIGFDQYAISLLTEGIQNGFDANFTSYDYGQLATKVNGTTHADILFRSTLEDIARGNGATLWPKVEVPIILNPSGTAFEYGTINIQNPFVPNGTLAQPISASLGDSVRLFNEGFNMTRDYIVPAAYQTGLQIGEALRLDLGK